MLWPGIRWTKHYQDTLVQRGAETMKFIMKVLSSLPCEHRVFATGENRSAGPNCAA